MLDRSTRRRLEALLNMTRARGATYGEEQAARAAIDRILKRHCTTLAKEGLGATRPLDPSGRDKRWWEKSGYEFRRCGKPRCRCMRGGYPHGPYRYAKKRRGRKVRSVYMGVAR